MINDTIPESGSISSETRLFGHVSSTQPAWLNDVTALRHYPDYDDYLKEIFVKLENLHNQDPQFIFTILLIQNIENAYVFDYVLENATPKTEAQIKVIMANFNSIMSNISRYNLLKYYKSFSDVFGKTPEWLKNAWLPLECEKGWYSRIKYAFQKIEKARTIEPSSVFYLLQVKEKFGTLRIYYHYDCSENLGKIFDALIKEAELESMKICEFCGKEGKMTLKYKNKRGGIGNPPKILCEKDMFRLNRFLPTEV